MSCHQRGELLIDVTGGGDQGWLVRAVLQVEGKDEDRLEPQLFVGSSGHGVVCAERGDGEELDSLRLRLVRLVRSATPQLQRMVLDGELLKIPASELERFANELCPSLRHVARVVSSDGSFSPPEISTPTLVLRELRRSTALKKIRPEQASMRGAQWQMTITTAANGRSGTEIGNAKSSQVARSHAG